MTAGDGRSSDYVAIEYQQFRPSSSLRFAMRALGVLSWPLAVPLALVSRLSDIVFRSCSESLSLIPYFPGVILRYEFYRWALPRCGENVVVELGAVLVYRDTRIGRNVLIGRYTILHHCDIGDDVLIGERCTLLSGSRQHSFGRRDVPMTQQGGFKRRIRIGSDVWLGSHAVIMADVSDGAVVAAAAVVNQDVPPFRIAGGVPARVIGQRPK
jgi:acetyltransferase-like isoleucine patch superfamily enzyme